MTTIQIIENGIQLSEFEFDDRAEAEIFVQKLLQKSPETWIFEPIKDRWVCGANVAQIVDVALTGPEKRARIEAKITTVTELAAKTEADLQTCQDKLAQLNMDLIALQEEKANV